MAQPTLHLRVLSPSKVLFEGTASSVSSKNSAGNFDILPFHANFITMVRNNPIIVRVQGQKDITFSFNLAIIYAASNEVKIYTDIQASLEEK